MDPKFVEKRKGLWLNWQNDLAADTIDTLNQAHEGSLVVNKSDEFVYGNDIKFGTAGMRELIGPGFSMINHSSVFAVTQGILKLLQKVSPDRLKDNGVIIGYDGRLFSLEFAKICAAVFSTDKNITKIRLFSKVVPTPTLAYASKHFGCAIGIMITASHNSKEFNGYKVYNENGCFINPPIDKQILDSINGVLANGSETDTQATSRILKENVSYEDPYQLIYDKFLNDILNNCTTLPIEKKKSSVGICYTAMHGVGQEFMCGLMKMTNFEKFHTVAEQALPDAKFSTVRDPNPEVGSETLKLLMETAEKNGCLVGFANDPDADRLGMIEKVNGEWKIYTGNEMAMVLIDYLLRKRPSEEIKNCCIYFSTVSSSFAKTLAKKKGFQVGETLTGFKFLGEAMANAKKLGKTPLLAFEESLGFLVSTHVLDKDGISSALVFSEIAEECYASGRTIHEYLTELMEENGYHITYNKYYKIKDLSLMPSIFDSIRNWGKPSDETSTASKYTLDNYPKKLGKSYTVTGVRDLTIGFDSTQPGGTPVLPVSKSNQMITFYTAENLLLTIRGSGTEPKLKFYIEKIYDGQIFKSGQFSNLASVVENIRTDAIDILDPLLKPEKNGLTKGF